MTDIAFASKFPLPNNETERVQALHTYHIFDTAVEKEFDMLASLASAICQVPVALITFIDGQRQAFKAHHGTDLTENLRELSFCTHAIASSDEIMIVPDATQDDRFMDNPMVTGVTKVVFYAGVPLINEDGFALGTLCVIDQQTHSLSEEQVVALKTLAKQVVDKLELRRKVRQLQLANQVLGLALDAGNLGSYDVDMRTGTMSCTEQFKKNFGFGKEAVLYSADLRELILPEYKDYVQQQLNTAIVNNTTYQAEYQVQWPDGSVHWINACGKTLYDHKGEVARMIGVVQDITERKKTEQRKDDFLSIVSHELKTPITTIKANLQLIDRFKNDPTSPVFSRLIDSSSRSLLKINSMVDDLLNMHRFSENQLQLDKSTFTISEMLHLCCNHVRVEGKYELIISGDEELQVCADEHRIDQVVVNFVNNAVKYAPDAKEIYLMISKEGDYAKVSVKDSGPGIPADHLPFLFDRYWRADHSGANYTGLGLGLYICSEIIKRHDGQIGAESEPGKGSTFWFSIPLNHN